MTGQGGDGMTGFHGSGALLSGRLAEGRLLGFSGV